MRTRRDLFQRRRQRMDVRRYSRTATSQHKSTQSQLSSICSHTQKRLDGKRLHSSVVRACDCSLAVIAGSRVRTTLGSHFYLFLACGQQLARRPCPPRPRRVCSAHFQHTHTPDAHHGYRTISVGLTCRCRRTRRDFDFAVPSFLNTRS